MAVLYWYLFVVPTNRGRDHGRDAALSVRYHKEHELAADALRPFGQSFMSRLRKPEMLKMSLSELREAGITPTVIASSGATWSQLCKAYGASALLDMGFEWRHLRACGITGEQACSLGMDAVSYTHLRAHET